MASHPMDGNHKGFSELIVFEGSRKVFHHNDCGAIESASDILQTEAVLWVHLNDFPLGICGNRDHVNEVSAPNFVAAS